MRFMRTVSLKKKILMVVAAVILVAFGVSWALLYSVVRNGVIRQATLELAHRTEYLASSLGRRGLPFFREIMRGWSNIFRGRITLVGSDGAVLWDSESVPQLMDNHLTRPEVQKALQEGEGTALRYSSTTKMYYLYFARRLFLDGAEVVIREAYPMEFLTASSSEMRNRLFLSLFMGVLLIALLGVWLVRLVFRPLDRIVDSADRLASGQEVRFPIMTEPELRRLSDALDRMSVRTHRALSDLELERGDLASIVTTLPAGVLLLDERRRVRYANRAAAELLAAKGPVGQGVPVERVLPSGAMYALVRSAVNGKEASGTFYLPELGNRWLELRTMRTSSGVLLVLSDLTEERRIEQSRRDFIADAGHELQTPLTTIRAAAEYLLETMDGDGDEGKYLAVIVNQQERMSRLVDDLLLLSRMESEPVGQEAEETDLSELLAEVVAQNREHPFAEHIEVTEDIVAGAKAMVRREDMSRALGNIVENGVKYVREKFGAEPGGRVFVSLKEQGDFWSIMVRDNGPGIPAETVPALFERFRRGDDHRARGPWGSGGYGLGLAMARRILRHSGGDVTCIPQDEGALFEIHVPKMQ